MSQMPCGACEYCTSLVQRHKAPPPVAVRLSTVRSPLVASLGGSTAPRSTFQALRVLLGTHVYCCVLLGTYPAYAHQGQEPYAPAGENQPPGPSEFSFATSRFFLPQIPPPANSDVSDLTTTTTTCASIRKKNPASPPTFAQLRLFFLSLADAQQLWRHRFWRASSSSSFFFFLSCPAGNRSLCPPTRQFELDSGFWEGTGRRGTMMPMDAGTDAAVDSEA